MSQNTTTLLLFFEQEQTHKDCLLMLLKLEQSNHEQALHYANRLKIDINTAWNDDWFNQSVSAQPDHIRVSYDTSTRYHLPLSVLQQLFSCGLKAAAIEIFFDQVGEYEQHYFLNNQQILRTQFYSKMPKAKEITTECFQCSIDELNEDEISKPRSISKLLEDQVAHNKDSQEMVSAMLDLARVSRENNTNPIETLKSALILKALGKGLFQSVTFATLTILLFKGIWLWISLSLLLAVCLPLYYTSKVLEDFPDETEEGEVAC
jgi:hypothetical protein